MAEKSGYQKALQDIDSALIRLVPKRENDIELT